MSHCTICRHTRVATIDERLDSGINQKKVAAEFAVSRFAVSRHCRKCRAPEPVLSSQDEIATWLQRANNLFLSATLAEDQRAAVQSLTAALRCIEAKTKQEEREAATPKPDDSEATVRLEDVDRLVSRLIEQSIERTDLLAVEKSQGLRDHYAKYDPRETPEQRLESTHMALIYDDLYMLFERCHADAELRSAVLLYARNWKSEGVAHVSQTSTSAN